MREKTGNKHGMNWIRPEKRLAIYLRDGLACCYCATSVEEGVVLTLDHLVPRAKRGTNRERNLVTACVRCNSMRGVRPWRVFAADTANHLACGITAGDIIRHIRNCIRGKTNIYEAREMIAKRGGFSPALKNFA